MVDVAALGLSVDSKPVEAATGSLQKFAAAAKGAETAANAYVGSLSKAATSAQQINQRLNVRDSFGGEQRAADIAAYGQAMDDLRAKFNPLFNVEREHQAVLVQINQAARVGAISEAEKAAAVQRAQVTYAAQTRAVQASAAAIEMLGRRGGLAGSQLSNLSFQLNDIATQAALGMDPLRIMAAQAGQVFQILQQGPGGVSGSLKGLGSTLLGLITPFRVITAAAVGFGTAALVAANSWLNAQNEIRLALTGVGAASGVTVTQINEIAIAAAAAGKATVDEAREMATAFAATGRVSADVAAQAVSIGRNVSKVFGEDISEAAARLAKALADPARGIDDLDRRLAAFDDKTAQHIKNLAAQGRFYEAQKILLDGVKSSTDAAASATNSWAREWDRVRQAASQYWDIFSRWTASALGIGPLEERAKKLRQELAIEVERLTRMNSNPLFFSQRTAQQQAQYVGGLQRQLAEVNRELDKIRANEALAKLNRDSRELGDLTRRYVGEQAAVERLIAEQTRLLQLASDPKVVAGLDEATKKELETARQIVALKIVGYKTATEKAQEEYDIAVQALNARTAAQKGDLAYRQALARYAPEGDPNAVLKATQARSLAIREHNQQILETQKQQILAADQKLQSTTLEFAMVGKTAAEQEKMRALLQVKQQLQAEALRLYGDENAYDEKHLRALQEKAAREAEITRQIKERQFYLDLQFQRDQMARAPGEQSTYSALQAAGLLTRGEIEGSAAEMAAAQLRLNYMLQKNMELSREFASSFVKDMMAGKNATEALHNALNRLADRLMDIGLDYAFQALFGGKSGANSILSGLFGGGGMGSGGGWDATVVPTFHNGGLVGAANDNPSRVVSMAVFANAKRYHGGAVIGANEVPAILEKGETVWPKGARPGGGNVHAPVTFNIDARGSTTDSIDALRADMRAIVTQLPVQIVKTVREARERGAA